MRRKVISIAATLGLLATTGAASLVAAPQAFAASSSTIVIGNSAEILGLDPDIRLSSTNARVASLIFQPLFTLNWKGQEVPMLATGYKNLSPTSWEFFLRKGVKFQDGTPWNAQAFVANLKRMFDPQLKSAVSSAIPDVNPNATQIAGPYAVIVHTKTPDAILPRRFSQYWLEFLSPKVIDGHSPAYVEAHPVGTGPYEFVSWQKDSRLTLRANPHYWGAKPTIQNVIFEPLPNDQSRLEALLSGQVDIAADLPTQAIAQLKGNAAARIVAAPLGSMMYFVYLDGRKGGPLASTKVILALNYAVNRQSIIKNVLDGKAEASGNPVTRQASGYSSSVPQYAYNLAKAKQLLAQAGYPKGVTTNLYYVPGSTPDVSTIVQALQQNFKAVGVTVNLVPQSAGVNLSQILAGQETDMFFSNKVNNTFDAAGVWSDASPNTPFGQYNPLTPSQVALALKAEGTFSPATRDALDVQLEENVHNNPHWVILWQQDQIWGVSSKVKGWSPLPNDLINLAGVTVQH